MQHCKQNVFSGRIEFFVGSFGPFWLVLLMVVDGFGWFWLILAGLGGFGLFHVLVPTRPSVCSSFRSSFDIYTCNACNIQT